jgi:hypothetical protein
VVGNKLIVESSVACKVGSRSLPPSDWTAVVQYLSPQCDFVVSPLSFLEVVRSMALGDERFIVEKLKRVEALSPVHPLNPVCLEMPAQFALREVLGKGPSVTDTYQPTQMYGDMVTLLSAQRMTNGLRKWLDEATSKLESGRDNFTSSHDSMRKVAQAVPTADKWVRGQFKRVNLSDDDVRKLTVVLSAAYEYAAWVQRTLKNLNYSPSEDKGAWIDRQQLFYLSDPTMYILCDDKDFVHRSGASPQRARLLRLPDVVAEARKLATSA